MNHKKATFLIAMPSITDSLFEKSVVLLSENEESGDLGLILNKATDSHVYNVLNMAAAEPKGLPDLSILFGGPVRDNFLWALHDCSYATVETVRFSQQIFLTPLEALLPHLHKNNQLKIFQVGVGYSGWSEEQLEHEIEEGSWWKGEFDFEKICKTPSELRWKEALEELGVHSDELFEDPYSGSSTIN